MSIQEILDLTIANTSGYKFGTIKITHKVIAGSKVGYAGGAQRGDTVAGYIVIDSRFVDYCAEDQSELINTIKHELAHLIAETVKPAKKKKAVWHGTLWQNIHKELGGTGERYYAGNFRKPEQSDKPKMSIAEMYAILPTQPATDWERGTFRQWLTRGYHVMKGQKGSLQVWEFNANEYETREDGKSSTWGRAAAVYFTPEQVEANAPKETK